MLFSGSIFKSKEICCKECRTWLITLQEFWFYLVLLSLIYLKKKIIISHLCFSQRTLYWISHIFPFIICCFFLTIFLKNRFDLHSPCLQTSLTLCYLQDKIQTSKQMNLSSFCLNLYLQAHLQHLFTSSLKSSGSLNNLYLPTGYCFLWGGPSSFLYLLKLQSECKPILSITFVILLWINPSIILEYDSKSSSCTLSPIFLNLSVI